MSKFSICLSESSASAIGELPIIPTRVLLKGMHRESPRPDVRESVWEIETAQEHLYSIEESITKLMSILQPAKSEIQTFCKRYELSSVFVTVVWTDEQNRPVYEVTKDTLKTISELESSWILDLV